MDQQIKFVKDDTYKVCNDTKTILCARFEVYGHEIHVHRPVDDRGRTRVQGWQFSKDAVPVSYLGQPCGRAQAIATFVLRAQEMGEADFHKKLAETWKSNALRLRRSSET